MTFTDVILPLTGFPLHAISSYLLTFTFFPIPTSISPAKRLLFTFIFSITLIPLLIVHTNLHLHLTITAASVTFQLSGLALISLLVFSLRSHQSLTHSTHSLLTYTSTLKPGLATPRVFALLLISMIACLVISLPLIHSAPLPGADSSFYLSSSADILRHHSLTNVFDRNIVLILPALWSLLTGLPIQTCLKLLVVCLYLLSAFTTYLLANRFTSFPLSILAFALTLINLGLLTLLHDVYAFLFANLALFFAVFLILDLINRRRNIISTAILISLLWGSLFHLHGIIAFASLALLGIPLTLTIILNAKRILRKPISSLALGFACAALIYLTGLPLISFGQKSFVAGAIRPLLTKASQVTQPETATGMEIPSPPQSAVTSLGQAKSNPPLSRFPLQKPTFIEFHALPLVLLAVLGLLTLLHSFVVRRHLSQQAIIFVTFSLAYFLLTQQTYFGVNWFPRRFVMSIFPLLITLAVIGYRTLIRWFKRRFAAAPSLIVSVSFASLLILFVPSVAAFNKLNHFTSALKDYQYQFYSSLSGSVTSPDLVFTSSLSPYWASGLNPDLNLLWVPYQAICGDLNLQSKLTKGEWQASRALSSSLSPDKSAAALTKIAGGNYYVVLQLENPCIDTRNFFNDHYQILHQTESLFLLKRVNTPM